MKARKRYILVQTGRDDVPLQDFVKAVEARFSGLSGSPLLYKGEMKAFRIGPRLMILKCPHEAMPNLIIAMGKVEEFQALPLKASGTVRKLKEYSRKI